jgi:hypothetical protein
MTRGSKWGRHGSLWSGLAALFVVCAALALVAVAAPRTATAQSTYEITSLGTDPVARMDRYQVTLGPGASLWELGFNRLPLVAIEQGDQKVVEIVEQSFRNAYPDRGPELVRPGDSFVLEVPTGTFVSKTVTRKPEQPDRVMFESFAGDELTSFPRDPTVQYRLRRHDSPEKIEVTIQGGQANAVDEAKKIYDVEKPDFLQVRTVRGALMERTAKITVDVNRRYLDDFRAVRDRATRVEDTPDGFKAHFFSREDQDVPFVRVDDAIGDETDPGNFPRLFRVAYHKDGTVRKFIITEAGDATGVLARPDSELWKRTLTSWQEWLPGQAEALPPFAPAISSAGGLLPGRILVLAFRPRTVQASPQPRSAAGGDSGLDCLGVPLGLIVMGGFLFARRRDLGDGAYTDRMVAKAALILAAVLVPPLVLRLLGRPRSGRFLGVPYDFSAPTAAKLRRTAWNPADDRVLAPHVYGWGYSVNFHALGRRLGLIGR